MRTHRTTLQYSWWTTHPNAAKKILLALLIVVSITTGVLIVFLTGSKASVRACRLSFDKTIQNPLDLNCDPRSIAIGDFNNDTWSDFVVTNRALNNISIFLGSTNETFSQSATYPTGSHSLPENVAVADLNNDQCLDIIVAYFGINSVGIFLGRCDGSFASHATISTASSRPIWLHLTHLDNDNSLDLVTVDYGTESISIFTGDGTGNFSYRMQYSTGYDSSPVSLTSADLNNDNHRDLIVANSGTNNIVIFFGQSNGEFSKPKVLSTGIHSHPKSIAVGHFNNDYQLDIAVANYGTNNVGVFWNTGNGTFIGKTTYMLNNALPYFIDVVDVNKDKQPDLIAIGRGTNNINILVRRGAGDFSRPIVSPTGFASSISVAIGDLNKDGLPDIAVIDNDASSVTVSFSEGERFQPETRYSAFFPPDIFEKGVAEENARTRRQVDTDGCYTSTWYTYLIEQHSLLPGDFNRDGHLDVMVSNVRNKELVLFLGFGNGSFTYQTIYHMDQTQTQLAIADFNSDMRLDIVLAYYSDEDARILVDVLFGYGNGSFTKQKTYQTSCRYPQKILAEDLNKDELVDLIVVGNVDICVLLSSGNDSFANSGSFRTAGSVNSAAIGDFDNDGRLDIILSHSSYSDVRVFLGHGNGSFARQPIYSSVFGVWSIDVADFNNDNISDIVTTAGPAQYEVNILLGFGNGSFNVPLTFASDKGPMDAAVGDFNNDQRMDIVVANSFGNNMRIFLGNGEGNFANSSTYSTPQGPTFALVADFNEDGRSDIMIITDWDINISVFIFSLIQFASKSIASGLTDASRLRCIANGDFNNDDIIDLVVVNYGTRNTALLLGHGDGSFAKENITRLDWNSDPQSIIVAHFNKDSRLDLAVANSGTRNIDLLLGDGKGALIGQNNDGYGFDRHPSIIVADDFDHDGISEIVVAYDSSDDIDILNTFDPGNFTGPITNSTDFWSAEMATGDFNHDNILDVATLTRPDYQIVILLGRGDGSFVKQAAYDAGYDPRSIVVGYFNNDSYLDIVIANFDGNNIEVWSGDGNGSFARHKQYPTSLSPRLIVVADFNNDTFSDFLVLINFENSLELLLSYDNGSVANPQLLQAETKVTNVAIGDMNGDELMDIIVSSTYDKINVLLGYGNGSFRTPITNLVEFSSFPLTTGDFNNDARLDIVLLSTTGIDILLGHGNGSLKTPRTYSIGCRPSNFAVADLNNDALLDIVISHWLGTNISVLLGDGNGSFITRATYQSGAASHFVVVDDFNNDHRMDILVTSLDTNSLIVFLGKFNQVFKRKLSLITGRGSSPRALTTAHFNSDTHLDIIVANSGTNSLGVFLGHGDGSFSTQLSSPTVSSPSLIATGHLNNDAHLDVVVIYFIESTIGVYLGNGNGSFINHTTYSTGVRAQPKSISVGDFDNDATLDIIVVNHDTSNVLVFVGHGDGSFMDAKEIPIGYGAHSFSVSVGDYDNDHKLDFALANNGRDNMEIYLQTCE